MLSSKLMSASSGGPVFVAQSSVVQTAGITLTLNIPTSRKSGDLLLALLGKQDNDLYGIPAGWTTLAELGASGGGGSNGNGAPTIVSKISDGTETTAAFTNAKGGCVGVIYVYSGATAGTAGAYATTATGTNNPICPSITMTSAGVLLCIVGAITNASYTTPSGMTIKTDSSATQPSIIIYEQSVSAGATGDRQVLTGGTSANGLLFPIY